MQSVKIRSSILALVLLAAALAASGCSSRRAAEQAQAVQTAAGSQDAAAQSADGAGAEAEGGDTGSESKEGPLDVSIGHAFEDSENLNVKVVLKARTDLDPKTVAVSLIGLTEGEVRQQETKLLSDEYGGETFEAGSTLAVLFRLSRRGLTEYQIKVGWGSDAEELVKATAGSEGSMIAEAGQESSSTAGRAKLADEADLAPPLAPAIVQPQAGAQKLAGAVENSAGSTDAALTLEGLSTEQTVQTCPSPPCDRRFVVTGELINHSGAEIQGAVLGLGLYWVENSGKLQTPEDGAPLAKNEEEIDLSSMLLKPGIRRKIRVTVDRLIPVVPGGDFHAHLRVINWGK